MWAWSTVEVAANKNLGRRGDGGRSDASVDTLCKETNSEMPSLHLDRSPRAARLRKITSQAQVGLELSSPCGNTIQDASCLNLSYVPVTSKIRRIRQCVIFLMKIDKMRRLTVPASPQPRNLICSASYN